MRQVTLCSETDIAGWRDHARSLLAARVPPEQVHWRVAGEGSLFSYEELECVPPVARTSTVPRAFLALAADVALHRELARFALLYRLLWRLQQERRLLDVSMDEDVARARAMAQAVQRDVHKMQAFVRFREATTEQGPVFIAWFEPTHHIVEAVAPFFVRRFAGQRWSILTPERSVHWDGARLSVAPGARRCDAPADDAHEALWRGYYASIFNPARLKVATMRGQMPVKYWRNLPEASLITPLVHAAGKRARDMIEAAPSIPRRRIHRVPAAASEATSDLPALHAAVQQCRACPLWANATQAVSGAGPRTAAVMLVGEQPGDQEDLAGRPFVGPAGQLLDRALERAGIERESLYVTNAVKHFKFEPRGKRRLHKKPSELEVSACRRWLDDELSLIAPRLVVALGATAAWALTGAAMTIDSHRGRIIRREGAPDLLITVHPSHLLRLPRVEQGAAFERFACDLQLAAECLRREATARQV